MSVLFFDFSFSQTQINFDNKDNLNYINFSFGYGYSFLYKNPVIFHQYFEGVKKVTQNPNLSFVIELSFLKSLRKNFLKFGLQYSSKNITESGKSWTGRAPDYYENYSRIESHDYLGVFIGFRKPIGKNIFLDNDFIIEKKIDDKNNYFLSRYGLSDRIKLGYKVKLYKKFNLEFNGFFSSAIIKYNIKKFNKNYFPYQYGLEVSTQVELF